MQRTTVAAVLTAALTAALITGCADPCDNAEPMYYNTQDQSYHYGSISGPLVPDSEVKAGCAADQQGDDVDVHKAPKAKTPTRKAK